MRYDVAVVGAGVFGAWTAWHLARAGKSVLLIDAWEPAHTRASSGGESRALRAGYGADRIYTSMAQRSLVQWRALVPALFHQTGVLWLAREEHPYTQATLETLAQVGVAHRILPAAELALAYPQMRLAQRHTFALLEPEAGALMARRSVAAVVEDAVRRGVTLERRAVQDPSAALADCMVFACGSWLPKLFPDLLGTRIRPTRQEVFFFASPAGDDRFRKLPVWIDFTDPRGPYGFPDFGGGVKLAFHREGAAFDPDQEDRAVSPESIREAREFLGEQFPDLSDAPLVETRVCPYENTSNGDFLIDRHPQFENTWLVGGGSGHGFKHGPAVGEYVAAQILGEGSPEPRFLLSSKSETQQRTVY